MKYIEKQYEFEELNQDMGDFAKLAKMPIFLAKRLIKANVRKIREAMGGDSKDITTRKITTQEKMIEGYKSDIRIRIYTPEEKKTRPLMMFYHGGGWIGGSIEAVDDYCKAVSDQADCIVISVEYHLAPEAKFPEGVEDAYKALAWGIENAKELNIDINQVCVSGDSAGGNFSAAHSLMARDRGNISISKQILLYPATILGENPAAKTGKREAFGEALIEMYLKNKKDFSKPYVSPLLCNDLSNLPKALIAVGDLDGLKDSSLKYAEALDEAGNDVTFMLFTNTRHAFIDNTGNCKQADDLIEQVVKFMSEK